MLDVALPKGRLGEKVYEMFAQAGYECREILGDSRKLVFENPDAGVRFFWAKPSDVAVYVERGAADIGVAGKDIIDGKVGFEELEKYALEKGEVTDSLTSGRQEYLESVLNQIMFTV